MKKVFSLLTALLISISLTLGCAKPTPTPSPTPSPTPFKISAVDDYGREVSLSKPPQRIVSLAPSNTEILFAIGAGDKVVGVTKFCDYPPEVLKAKEEGKIQVVGGFGPRYIDEEKIVTLNPDLLIGTSIYKIEDIRRLEEKTKAPFFTVAPKDLEGLLEGIKKLGAITGMEEGANEVVKDMEVRIKAVAEKTKDLPPERRPKVFHLVFLNGGIWTAGRETFQDDLINKAGGVNITLLIPQLKEKKGWGTIMLEDLISVNPDVIVTETQAGNIKNYEWAKTEERLKDVSACKTDRIFLIEADLIARPGPRIVQALELYAKFVHPELFGEPPAETHPGLEKAPVGAK